MPTDSGSSNWVDRDGRPTPSSSESTTDRPLSRQSGATDDASNVDVEIGILTRGKPTLGMVLTSLLLQEAVSVRIHVVDTSARPIITRDDVRFALRLAGDRGIRCSYEYAGESKRAFSLGRARIIRELAGPNLCLCDDDIVLPSGALSRLVNAARLSGTYGYICPVLVNAPSIAEAWGHRPRYTPGSLIFQDDRVRGILLEYYGATIDVLDQDPSEEKVWEPAFLMTLFEALNRSAVRQSDTVIYHLDYQEDPSWIADERTVIARSRNVARALVERSVRLPPISDVALPSPATVVPQRRGRPTWLERARRVMHRRF